MKNIGKIAVLSAIFLVALRLFTSLHNSDATPSLRAGEPLVAEMDGTPDRPIVGIVSLSTSAEIRKNFDVTSEIPAIIPSSYVKWLQSAGAQVVVIPHFWNSTRIESLVGKLSAVLFTGGDYGDADWNRTTAYIVHEAIRRSTTDSKLALWGTCLGYERIMQVVTEDETETVVPAVLIDVSIPVQWTGNERDSQFLHYMGSQDLNRFRDHPIAYNFHSFGVTPESWNRHSAVLDSMFDIVGWHVNGNETFVAMIEGRNGLPIWGVQFHPEKALFEWSPSKHYPHSEKAVLANRKIADFLVSQVRKIAKSSQAGFDSFQDESQFAIYNYKTIFTGVSPNSTAGTYTETYIIDK